MPKLVYTEGFIDDMTQVELETKRKEIFECADLLAVFPELGSSNVSASITKAYGDTVRRLVVKPFLIIYEYREDDETVYLLGLDHQRTAW